jgi:hypothetical protein
LNALQGYKVGPPPRTPPRLTHAATGRQHSLSGTAFFGRHSVYCFPIARTFVFSAGCTSLLVARPRLSAAPTRHPRVPKSCLPGGRLLALPFREDEHGSPRLFNPLKKGSFASQTGRHHRATTTARILSPRSQSPLFLRFMRASYQSFASRRPRFRCRLVLNQTRFRVPYSRTPPVCPLRAWNSPFEIDHEDELDISRTRPEAAYENPPKSLNLHKLRRPLADMPRLLARRATRALASPLSFTFLYRLIKGCAAGS